MKPDVARRLALLLALALAAGALALAADTPRVVGTWDVVASTPNGDLSSVLIIKSVEGQLKAEIEIDGVKRTVSGEKLDGAVFSMNVEYDGNTYAVEAKVDGDTMEGNWSGSGSSGMLKAKRRP
jgi:hypothetical protein